MPLATAPIKYEVGGTAKAAPEVIALLLSLPASITALKTSGGALAADCDALIAEVEVVADKTGLLLHASFSPP